MKELDIATANYIRFVDSNYQRLREAKRARIVVVWLDGDQDILAAWARDNKIRNLPLCVADSQIESLQPWNLNAGAAHTVILLKRRKVLAAYGELLSPTPARLMGESAIFD